MRRIAHLSDVHILDPEHRRSSTRYRFAAKAVSLGRPVDPRTRARKLARGLEAAKASGADHFVISGDLTELGDATEFEYFASILDDAKLPDGTVTLVPGNHDAYTSGSAWRRALEGPLKPYASASATDAGKVVERGEVVLLPINTSSYQSIAFSGGTFTPDAAKAVQARLDDPSLKDKTLLIVQHHPPFEQHKNPISQWVDGLRGCKHVLDMLANHPRLSILHGHLHRVVDRIVGLSRVASARREDSRVAGAATKARILGAPAVCDDADEKPRVRLYDVRDGALEAVGLY